MVDVVGFTKKFGWLILIYLGIIALVIINSYDIAIVYVSAIILILIVLNHKKIDVQAKIIAMYRMKWGIKWMKKYAAKFREWIILLGYIGVGVGFLGMIFITWTLVKNLYDLIITPDAVSGVSLVLPGINVPGLGILPFWYWLIAIFVIAVVHEFGHGIVAKAHKIPIKNTGIVLFGPIIGAFVEPNEKKLRKEKDIKQYSVLAAGAWANVILAVVALLMLNFVATPLQQNMVEPTGFTFDQYVSEEYPFAQAGIETGTVINKINDVDVMQFQDFSSELSHFRPGDTITVGTAEGSVDVVLAESPEVEGKAFLGINSIRNEFEIKEKYQTGAWNWIYYIVAWFVGFFRWLFLLSLGIGLFNLLPLPIVDGGRMAQVFLQKWRGEKRGNKYYHRISMFILLILLLNLFFPLLVKLF